jgi:Dockerin type I domain
MNEKTALSLSRAAKLVIVTVLLCLVFVGGLPSPRIPRVRATVSFTLIGKIVGTAGWGFTKTSISSPGPDLVVAPGDQVTMTLASADPSIFHNWGVDYNNNTVHDPGEPMSVNFDGARNVTLTFTATTTPGTYEYTCFIHLAPMIGHFIVTPPAADVAVTGITSSRLFAYAGVPGNPLQVNVTAANVGTLMESFFVSALANSTLIGNQTVTLAGGTSIIVSFLWSTSSLIMGHYTLSAQATKVPGETNFSNNLLTGNTLTVRLRGDLNGDCKVNIIDFSTVGGNFGRKIGDPAFNPNADFNNDGVINIIDFSLVGGAFGLAC